MLSSSTDILVCFMAEEVDIGINNPTGCNLHITKSPTFGIQGVIAQHSRWYSWEHLNAKLRLHIHSLWSYISLESWTKAVCVA